MANTRLASLSLIVVAMLAAVALAACGGTKGKKVVELDISPKGVSQIERAAPSADFAFYVAAESVPTVAADLKPYALVDCTRPGGDLSGNENQELGVAIGIANGIGNWGVEHTIYACSEGIANALGGNDSDGAKALVLAKRASEAPSDAVEIVFK
jgi:hypothetical protein